MIKKENPYVVNPAFGEVVRAALPELLKLGGLTAPLSMELTAHYFALVGFGLTRSNPHNDVRALMFEVALFAHQVTTKDREVEFGHVHDDDLDTATVCNNPDHDHSGDIGVQMIEAFLSAAARGDMDAAIRVVDAVEREAENEPDDEGEVGAGVHFFAINMVNLALNVRRAAMAAFVEHSMEHMSQALSNDDALAEFLRTAPNDPPSTEA